MADNPPTYHRPLPLTTGQLEALCPAGVYRQAARYAKSAHMVDRLRIGGALYARFHGTRGIYSTRIEVAERDFKFECTCPLANPRQPCKHAIALGLGWLESPGSFHDLDVTLARLTHARKADILTLLRQAAQQLPELVPLLDRRRPS